MNGWVANSQAIVIMKHPDISLICAVARSLLFLSVCAPGLWAGDKPDPYEWVIESYSLPDSALADGFTSPERGELRAPAMPADGATDEEIGRFLRRSHSIAAHYLETVGLALPKGALLAFDPESGTLAARAPRITQSSLAFYAASCQQGTPSILVLEPVIVEAPGQAVRELLRRAGKQVDHRDLLDELEGAAGGGGARVVASGKAETRSGLVVRLVQADDLLAPAGFALVGGAELVEYEMEQFSGGTIWEIDPTVSQDHRKIDLTISLQHHYAPLARKARPVGSARNLEVLATVTEAHKAEVELSTMMSAGTSRLVAAWPPAWRPGAERDEDVMQAAFITAEAVRVMPLREPRLSAMLEKFGGAVEPVPAGRPEFASVAEEIPDGMIVRRYIAPPDVFASDPSAAVDDPFSAPSGNEPRFTVRATVKDLLAAMGVPFPAGSSANYLPATSTLVVRNTPEAIELVESILDSSLRREPKLVEVTVQVVSGPEARLRALSGEVRGLPDHTQQWEALLKSGEARVLACTRLSTRSGLLAKARVGRTIPYPSAFSGYPMKQQGESTKADSESSGNTGVPAGSTCWLTWMSIGTGNLSKST
jgi:hypothetical protein